VPWSIFSRHGTSMLRRDCGCSNMVKSWRCWSNFCGGKLRETLSGKIWSFREMQNTVFGKHCECTAQKCTHLGRFPPLVSHLLLLRHCVLTWYGGQKKVRKKISTFGLEPRTIRNQDEVSANCAQRTIDFHKLSRFWPLRSNHFKIQITSFCCEREKSS